MLTARAGGQGLPRARIGLVRRHRREGGDQHGHQGQGGDQAPVVVDVQGRHNAAPL